MPPSGWGSLDALWGELPTDDGGKEMPSAVKAEEEILKFTVDEHLSEVERTVLYLNGGQLIQQRHAIVNLPAVIKGRGRPAFDSISQSLKTALNKLDAEAQISTAEAFAAIARERLLSPVDLQVCILPMVTRSINKEKSEEETDAWLSALFELIPLLDKEVLKNEVLSLALSKGDVEGNVGSRTICVRILGALAPRLTWDEIERTFFKKALSMCQDVDHQIRINTCNQLAAIARIAGRDVTAKTILPELFELLNDEAIEARMASLMTLACVLDMLPPEVRKGQVLPILRNHMQPLDLDIVMQRTVAKVFGQLVSVVKADFEQDDAAVFFGCFKHLAAKADVELRRTCAGQLPAVLRAAAALSASAFQSTFQDTLNGLAADGDVEVRRTLAGSFHEVARIVGKDSPALLTRALCRLLRDDNQGVQAALLPALTQTLAHWQLRDEGKREAAMAEVVKALVDMDSATKRNWRLQQQLAASFSAFPQVFSSDQIFDHFLPIAWRYLSSAAAAVRPSAADGIACFFRYNRKEKQRADILLRMIRDFCRGRSFSQRIAFADLAQHMVRRFSSRWVKEYVFDLVLELLYDPVPNVRIVATGVLPILKQCIRLPEDVDLLERLNSAMSNTMTDNDRDVSQNARTLNEQYKKAPMRMGGASGGMLDMSGSGGSGAMCSEADDARKEEEEQELTFTPEDLKEIKAEILQVGAGKKPGGGGMAGKANSANRGRAGGVGAPGERVSAPQIAMRPAYAGSNSSPMRRVNNASEDGTARGAAGGTVLNAVRPPPSMASASSVRSAGSSAVIGSASPSKAYGAGAGGLSTGGSPASKSPSGVSSSQPRLGAVTSGGKSLPSSPLLSSAGGGGMGSPPPNMAGVRLPAITPRSSPPLISAGSGAGGGPALGGKSGPAGRLTSTTATGSPTSAGAKPAPLTAGGGTARKGPGAR